MRRRRIQFEMFPREYFQPGPPPSQPPPTDGGATSIFPGGGRPDYPSSSSAASDAAAVVPQLGHRTNPHYHNSASAAYVAPVHESHQTTSSSSASRVVGLQTVTSCATSSEPDAATLMTYEATSSATGHVTAGYHDNRRPDFSFHVQGGFANRPEPQAQQTGPLQVSQQYQQHQQPAWFPLEYCAGAFPLRVQHYVAGGACMTERLVANPSR